MFIPGVIVIKIKKWLIFLFSADDDKKSVTFRVKFLSTSERYYLASSENALDYWILSYI